MCAAFTTEKKTSTGDDSRVAEGAFDDLARMVAHEVRNALSPLRVAAQTAMTTPLSGEDAELLAERVLRTIDRVSIITEAILDREQGPITRVASHRAIEQAAWACSTGNIDPDRLEFDRSESVTIRTDGAALHHILANLIANAIRASAGDPSKVTVSAERSTWNTPGGVASGVAFTVTDCGPGFRQLVLVRLNGDDEISQAGSRWQGGVGLEIVRRLVRLIGGQIHAENLPSGGARVRVLAPDQSEVAAAA